MKTFLINLIDTFQLLKKLNPKKFLGMEKVDVSITTIKEQKFTK